MPFEILPSLFSFVAHFSRFRFEHFRNCLRLIWNWIWNDVATMLFDEFGWTKEFISMKEGNFLIFSNQLFFLFTWLCENSEFFIERNELKSIFVSRQESYIYKIVNCYFFKLERTRDPLKQSKRTMTSEFKKSFHSLPAVFGQDINYLRNKMYRINF